MSDAVDTLEQAIQALLEHSGAASLLPEIYRIVDGWRQQYGGADTYLCKRSQSRRHAEVMRLSSAGLPAAQIAKQVGLSAATVRRIRSVKSGYLR